MKLPNLPKEGRSLAADFRDMVNFLRASRIIKVIGGKLRETPNGTTIEIDQPRLAPAALFAPNPWDTNLIKITPEIGAETYQVTVEDGLVIDHVPGDTDALVYHEASNILVSAEDEDLGADPPIAEGDRTLFDIAVGEAIYVKVNVLPSGAVGESSDPPEPFVEIVVDEDGLDSAHYVPPCADDADGLAGYYYYKLALLEEISGEVVLTKYRAGSHIEHFCELPLMDNVGAGNGKVLKDYDQASNTYRFRNLDGGLGELTITNNADDIEIRGNKKSLNLMVQYGETEATTPTIAFVDGLTTTGATVVGDEDPAVDPSEATILIPAVDDAGQINVSLAGNTYTVRGNSKDSTLGYSVDGGTRVVVGTWVDGLRTDDGDDFTIPVSSGASSHPWKVTNGGSGNATIAAGFIHAMFMDYDDAVPQTPPATNGIYPPTNIVMGPAAEYAGGNLAITGTQYIYAEMIRGFDDEVTLEYTETKVQNDEPGIGIFTTLELYDDIDPAGFSGGSPGATATLVASSDAPDSYTATTGYAAVCIAKVTNTAGTISVDKQYITHNPTLFVPIGWASAIGSVS